MSQKVLLEKQYNRWLVIKEVKPTIYSNNNKSRNILCKCECGNEKIVKTVNLNRGSTTSCGCLISQYGKALKPGDKRNNLTVISYNKGKWLCHCICGSITEVSTYNLNMCFILKF